MNKKRAVICCVIGAIGLTYGGMNFELNGIRSTALAIAVSMSITFGAVLFLYGVYSVFKGEDKTTTANEGEKPMAKTKETKTTNDTSVELMKREKELFDREKEFEKLVSEIKSELAEVQEKISSKGWTAKEDGSWVIE
tara:strand:- start:609 stop:1022 length:414 start_codon:yes stop_codon:yes gene_type:complete